MKLVAEMPTPYTPLPVGKLIVMESALIERRVRYRLVTSKRIMVGPSKGTLPSGFSVGL